MRLVSAFLATLLAVALPAQAAECTKAYALNGGVLSPCSGVLLPTPDARTGLNCLQVDLPLAHSETDYARAVHQADRAMFLKLLTVEKNRSAALDDLVKQCVAPAKPAGPQWWETKSAAFAGGVLLGLGAASGLVYLAR